MDSINFLGKSDFPNSSQTMDMVQGIGKMGCSAAAKLGGDNYILSGCIDRAGVVSDGIIVIEGMPYNFEGGNKKTKLTIKEVKETLMAFGVEYPEARTKRSVVFSDNGPYNWGDFKQVLTNTELEKRIESIKGTPLGIPEMWVGYLDKIPPNYRLCNGDFLSQTEYPELFKVIGTIHGTNSQTNFALPDMRQMFLVGYDNRHNDYNEIGKTGGKEKVQLTEKELPAHKHIMPWGENVTTEWNPPWGYADDYLTGRRGSNSNDSDNAFAWTSPAGSNQAHENRPPFFTIAYIMKVKN